MLTFGQIGQFIGNSFKAIVEGRFFVRLGVAKYFFHILYVFVLIALTIWISLVIDNTMNKVEKNKAVLKDLEIVSTMKRYELEKCNDRRVVLENLRKMGSEVTEPSKPATRLVD